jgi:hypothetical protein
MLNYILRRASRAFVWRAALTICGLIWAGLLAIIALAAGGSL